jgi:tetratricopeptide (TPR) repeat protein
MVTPGSLPLPRSTDRLWQERGDSLPVFDNDQIAPIATDSFSVLNNPLAGEMMAFWRTLLTVPSTSLYIPFAASSLYPGSESHMGLSFMSLFGMSSHLLPTMNGVWPACQNSPLALDDDTEESIPPIGNHVETSSTPQALFSSVSCRRRSGPSISHLLPLATPHTLSVSEECMHLLRIYVSGNFDSGAWRGENFTKGQDDVAGWYNEAGTAFDILDRGNTKQGFRLLNKSLGLYKQLLAAPSFVLFYNTYNFILLLSHDFPDVAKEVMRYVGELSQIIHQYRHPFGTLMKKIHAVDVSELRQWSASLLDCYSECLESYIDAGSDLMPELIYNRGFVIRRLAELGWLDFHVAEDQIVKALVALEQYGDFAWSECLHVKNLLADLYARAKRYHKARAITLEALESAESRGLHHLASNCYSRLCWLSRAEGSTDKALDWLNQWVAFCSAEFGRGHQETITALNWQDFYLRELGRADAANEARQEFDAAMDELCGEIEEL